MQKCSINNKHDLQNILSKTNHNIYILLDGAKFENIHSFIYTTDECPKYIALYQGTFYESAKEVSPCLVQLKSYHDCFLQWYFLEGANTQQAILMTSEKSIVELSKHFRNFLEARLPNMDIVLFRFYEPNVLHTILKFYETPQVKSLISLCSGIYWKIESSYCGIINNIERGDNV